MGGEEEEPQRRGRGERGMSRGRKELHRATGDCRTGPAAHPGPAQHRQQGLNLLSPPLRSFWPVLNTDGDRHWNTDKGSRLHLLLDALCTEQRGKFSITGHLNH